MLYCSLDTGHFFLGAQINEKAKSVFLGLGVGGGAAILSHSLTTRQQWALSFLRLSCQALYLKYPLFPTYTQNMRGKNQTVLVVLVRASIVTTTKKPPQDTWISAGPRTGGQNTWFKRRTPVPPTDPVSVTNVCAKAVWENVK